MKNLITSIACIVILLAFVLQFTSNQVIYNHIISIDQEVNAFKETAKQEGYITAENEKRLIGKIRYHTGVPYDEIKVSGTDRPVFRGEPIHYRVTVPIKDIVGAAGFWRIDGEKNQFNYVIDRYTTSEYIGSE